MARQTINQDVTEYIVAHNPGATTKWFRRSLLNLLNEIKIEAPEEIEDYLDFVPDAYCIDREKREIRIYEVEVTYLLKDWKLWRYIWLWLDMPSGGWTVRLFSANRWGSVCEIDLKALYCRAHGVTAVEVAEC